MLGKAHCVFSFGSQTDSFTIMFFFIADENIPAKILSYNRANRAVAILCNHQRAPPKTFEKSMMNLQSKVSWIWMVGESCLLWKENLKMRGLLGWDIRRPVLGLFRKKSAAKDKWKCDSNDP